MLTTKIIELEMSAQPKRGFTEVKQNDADGVQLRLTLRNSDYTAYLIPDGSVVSFLAVKSDKKSVVLSSTDDIPRITYTANSNIVLVTLPAQVLAVAGIILCNVTISKSGATTSTQTFTLSCAEALTADDLTSSSEFQSLSKMLADLTARKAEFDAINDKIANMALGYGGTFPTLAALQADSTANTPDGKKRFYIVAANGHHYYWSNITSAWADGGAIIPYADVVALKNDVIKIFGDIGIGIEYGCEVLPSSPPTNNTVYVTAGAAHLPNGQTVTISGQTVMISGYGYGIIFINSSGAIDTLAGDDINDPVPATPDGALLLAKVYLYDGTSTLDASKITDMRKFTYGLRSYVKNTTYESIGARMNAIEEDAESLEARVTQAETEIDALQVRAAQTDAELAAIRAAQAQMSSDTRIDLPSTGKVTLVPKNAAVMGVGGTVNGMTLQNLFEEYKLRGADLIGWVNDGTSSTISISNNVVTVTGTGNSATVGAAYWGKIKAIQNNKYLVRFKAMATNSDCQQIRVQVGGNTQDVITTPLATGTWYEGSTIINSPTTNVAQIVFYFVYADAATASGKSVQIKECSAINLTAWGLDTKSTVDMLMISPNVFSGTQSVTPMRLRSVNKNLFDVSASDNWEIGTLSNTIGDVLTKTSSTTILRYKHWKKIPLKPNTQYIFTSSTFATYSVGWRLIDEDNIIVALKSAGTSNYTFTSPSFVSYLVPVIVRVDSAAVSLSDVLKVSAQLEEGMSSSSIESHKATACYIEPRPMRRLPNGVCDTVALATGKRIINVFRRTLLASDIVSITTTYTNIDVVIINKPTDFIYYNVGGWDKAKMQALYIDGFTAAVEVSDDASTVYTMFNLNATSIGLVVPKGLYANISAAQAALSGREFMYQLANPAVENNVVTGTLVSYPKGLILCEPVIADAGIYNNGITILRTAYPIQSLETLCKVNADGTQTPLDTSAATVASGGLSFTHPSLANGDIAAFTYYTATAGIIGENIFNYVNANGLTLGADGKYYKVGFAIDINGNISLTKTEVV